MHEDFLKKHGNHGGEEEDHHPDYAPVRRGSSGLSFMAPAGGGAGAVCSGSDEDADCSVDEVCRFYSLELFEMRCSCVGRGLGCRVGQGVGLVFGVCVRT